MLIEFGGMEKCAQLQMGSGFEACSLFRWLGDKPKLYIYAGLYKQVCPGGLDLFVIWNFLVQVKASVIDASVTYLTLGEYGI